MSLPVDSEPRREPATLEGVLERIVYANEESAWSVVKLSVPGQRDLVTAVGNLLGVRPGENLRLSGRWEEDPRFGRQLRVESYMTVSPSTVVGLERYLGSGLVPGIGKVMAKRLVARFGIETLTVIEEHPQRLSEVEGIGPKRSQEIRRAWQEQRGIKDVMVFLQAHGVSTSHAIKIYKRYAAAALHVVRENPYRLAIDLHGVGFKTADSIAASLGVPKDSPRRVEAGVLHVLGLATERGHLFLPRERLAREGAELLGVDPALVLRAVAALAGADGGVGGAQVVLERLPRGDERGDRDDRGEEAVYPAALHTAETGLAARLLELAAHPPAPLALNVERALAWLGERQRMALAPAQQEAIRRGLTSKVLVITGGPGTGKTTLVQGIVRILEKKGQRMALAAPTGRAAKRLSEATGREAATLHRQLEWNARSFGFDRNRSRPLDADLVIVDEASMLDTVLAWRLLEAVPDEGRLILVGDVDQLPSVGPGRVLGDLIRSGAVDVVRLTEIFRQAERSLIVVNAHRINRGDMPVLTAPPAEGRAEGEPPDFFFIERKTPEEVLETIKQVVSRRIPGSFGFDPVEEVQVLTPMNRGLLGTDNLNRELRELLNPAPEGETVAGGRPALRPRDKVMQVRNNYDLEVWNGDIGRVAAVDEEERTVRVAFDGREVLYDAASADELSLAYACSIHKSQGSEYPAIVVPLHTQHYVMLERNLLYTALTRAKRLAVLVGEARALGVAVRNRHTRERFTLLAERLRSQLPGSGVQPGGGAAGGS